ncbi:MAG: hypothetical protein SGPRY_007461, partial [Prymnesium sp.]
MRDSHPSACQSWRRSQSTAPAAGSVSRCERSPPKRVSNQVELEQLPRQECEQRNSAVDQTAELKRMFKEVQTHNELFLSKANMDATATLKQALTQQPPPAALLPSVKRSTKSTAQGIPP